MPFTLAPDKLLHFYAGLPLGFALVLTFKIILNSTTLYEIIWATFITAAISFGFEWFSKITGWGVHDLWDAVATMVGGAVGIAVAATFFT